MNENATCDYLESLLYRNNGIDPLIYDTMSKLHLIITRLHEHLMSPKEEITPKEDAKKMQGPEFKLWLIIAIPNESLFGRAPLEVPETFRRNGFSTKIFGRTFLEEPESEPKWNRLNKP